MGVFRHLNNRRKAWRTGALVMAVLFVSGSFLPDPGTITARAATQQDRISESKQKISDNKKKIEEIRNKKYQVDEKLKELNRLKSDAAAYVARLDQELAEIEAQIEELTANIAEVEGQITVTEAELEEAKAEEASQYASMKLRIKYMYEHGSGNLLDILFQAGSFSDLLNQAEYIENVSVYDRDKLEEYVAVREMVAAR